MNTHKQNTLIKRHPEIQYFLIDIVQSLQNSNFYKYDLSNIKPVQCFSYKKEQKFKVFTPAYILKSALIWIVYFAALFLFLDLI
jgi:hypothetical protein